MTGSVEDLNVDGQAALAGAISRELVAVVTERGKLTVSKASELVADRMSIGESQVGYGVAFARITHALKFDTATYTLSL